MTKFKNNVIGDNTPENVRVLVELGYMPVHYNASSEFIICFDGEFDTEDQLSDRAKTILGINDIIDYFNKRDWNLIDCRNNPKLFKEKVSERSEGC